MKYWILAGLAAAWAALLVPLLTAVGAAPVAEAAVSSPSAAPAPSQRAIAGFVVHQAAAQQRFDDSAAVTVTIQGAPREMALSEYLCGVLMGEMPASFPLEALKAQAVAARTYTLRRMEQGGELSDDPAVCQAFCDPAGAREKFGDDAAEYLEKLRRAVRETDGQVLTYDGDLIAATYFSCSGGRTESAQAVWGSAVPYLLSVESPGEEDAGSYESQVTLPLEELRALLEVDSAQVEQVEYTDGGGVDTMTIGGKTFSGVALRKALGLRSTCFTLAIQGDTAVFSVRGNGHRVGLSQYGAKAMAEAGSDYRAILAWYYTGAELSEAV